VITAQQQAALYYSRKRKRLARIAAAAPPPFDPLDLFKAGEKGGWYDPSDMSSLFQDSAGTIPVTANNQPVGMMKDKSGRNNHLLQTTAGFRPLFKTSGGFRWIEGDGVDDLLTCTTLPLNQPIERISAIRQLNYVSQNRIFCSATATTTLLIQSLQAPGSLALYSGAELDHVTGLSIGVDGVITERHNGTSGRIAVNNTAYVTGDTGTNAMAGLTLFSQTTGGSYSNTRCYGVIIREGTMTDTQIANARTWLGAKAGLTL